MRSSVIVQRSAAPRFKCSSMFGFLPALKTAPADFSAYDTVFIGFPVWAATIPDFLQEYIRQADLAGKRVIPFATAGNNGRDESLAALKALLPDSEITDYFYTSMVEKADADAWLEGIRE